jgi:hypothetical protein
METRTTGVIALRPTGNAQGGYVFLSLTSGRQLSRHQWTELPMPQNVIDRVHVLACHSNSNRDLTFAWRDGTTIADEEEDENNDDDSTYDPEDDGPYSDSDSDTESVPDDDADNTPPDDLDLPIAGVDEQEPQDAVPRQ